MANLQCDKELGWMPAIPLPYYCSRWIFWPAFRCECGRKFKTERDYQIHYALTHIAEGQGK